MEAREWPYVVEYEEMRPKEQWEWDAQAYVDPTINEHAIVMVDKAKHKCLSCHRFHYNFTGERSESCPYCGSRLLEAWEEPTTVYLCMDMGTGKCVAEEE